MLFFNIKKEKKNYFSIIKKKLLLALKKGVFILHWNLNKMFLYYFFIYFIKKISLAFLYLITSLLNTIRLDQNQKTHQNYISNKLKKKKTNPIFLIFFIYL